jgi:hypothetical protein
VTTASVTLDTSDSNPANNTASASVTIANAAPSIGAVSASTTRLWPANHKMVEVRIAYDAVDACGSVQSSLSVTSNEPIDAQGDGNTAPDWLVLDAHRVQLRAERSGGGSGRVYTITITARDAAGQSATQQVTVVVPRHGH